LRRLKKLLSSEALVFYAGVAGIAVAAPLFAFIAGNREFIHVGWPGYLSVIVCFYVLPPISLFAIDALIGRIHHALSAGLRRGAAFGGLAVIVMQATSRYGISWEPWVWAPLLVLIFTGVWRLWSVVEQIFVIVGVLSPVVVGYLLYAVNSDRWQRPDIAGAGDERVVISRGPVYSGPIFLLIYDGFAIEAALDSEGRLLPRYKNLRRLAKLGMWVPDATTNYDSSFRAIPSMLAGSFAGGERPSRFPEGNLLSWLGGYYVTELYGLDLGYCSKLAVKFCHDESVLYSRHPEWLVKGLFLSYIRMSFPARLQAAWPWWRLNAKAMSKELSEMIIESVEKVDLQNRFYFFHISVPHEPYVLDGAGNINNRGPILDAFTGVFVTPADIGTILEHYRQEIDFVDGHLGRLLDALEARGWLPNATLVVVSDHGVSWNWEHRGRTRGVINSQIARIPCFIKPHAQFRYRVIRNTYEHVDLVPTMFDMLGIIAPRASFDGSSLFSEDARSREKRAFSEGVEWKADASGTVWRRVGKEAIEGRPEGDLAR
jgi:hypothetical protein